VRRVAWCLVLVGCVVVPVTPQTRPNLLLVTVDALRADRISESLTPTIVALAARGVRFERAYTHAPLTLPAHTSILTGLLPPGHGVRNNGFRLDDSVVTLAEVLSDAGYRTAAFVGASALDARFGLTQGFHEYNDRYELLQGPSASGVFRHGARPATDALTSASRWLANQTEPWFIWTHLRDPHAPYAAYERGVTSADAALGTFISSLPKSVADRTLIIVTADHGESLGQHGERTHGVFAYEGALRVPLVMAGPGVEPRVVRAPVASLADVTPTALQLLNLTAGATDGRSLLPAMRGEAMEEHPIYFEALDAALMRGGAPLTGVVMSQWKYIDVPLPELYDVIADPGERTNQASNVVNVATTLRDATIRQRTGGPRADAAGSLAEPEARARLRSLGYVGSASWRLGASRVEDDPKRLLPLHLAYDSAIETAAGDPESAMAQLRKIVDQRPDFAAAIDALGALLIARGRAKDAVTLLAEARAGGLRHRVLAERLAAALLAMKDARGAVAVLEPVVDTDAAAADARFLLARAYAATGNTANAIAQLRSALEIDPTFTAAADYLARLQAR
jgi:choline-sulfatase